MSEPRYVYQLQATLEDPFCGNGTITKFTTTVFADEPMALKRIGAFKQKIRDIYKLKDDYPVDVTSIKLEIIDDNQ